MKRLLARRDPHLGRIAALSLFLHLLLVAGAERISRLGVMPVSTHLIHEVDIVSLPGSLPVETGSPPLPDTAAPPPPADTPLPSPRTAPSLPAKSKQGGEPAPVESQPAPAERDVDLEQRIEGIRRKQEERHLEEALSRLRERGATPSPRPPGTPEGEGGTGGADYTSQLHRLLSEAFRETITYQSAAPEAVVRIIIDGRGRLIGTRMERRSGDRLFDDAVLRAIGKVGRTLHPPPDGRVYEHGFVFKPEGVGK